MRGSYSTLPRVVGSAFCAGLAQSLPCKREKFADCSSLQTAPIVLVGVAFQGLYSAQIFSFTRAVTYPLAFDAATKLHFDYVDGPLVCLGLGAAELPQIRFEPKVAN